MRVDHNEQPVWHAEFQDWLKRTASAADDLVDAGIRRLRKRLGREGIPQIQPYMGYASEDTVYLHGRILTNPPIEPDFNNTNWWQNLSEAVQRFASDEVPDVEVEATVAGFSGRAISDAEGYFHIPIPRPPSFSNDAFWQHATLRIVSPLKTGRLLEQAVCGILNVPDHAAFAVISDIDDTILHTGATDIATMVRLTFFGNARTRAPLEGVAELYEQLQTGVEGDPTNPVFYISSSPWNLYDLLEDFLELNAIPRGPLLLRDLGFDENKFLKSGHDHKLVKARRLLDMFDKLPFILFGDSGQEDARLYASAAEEYPDRIKAVFIRDIDPASDSEHDAKVEQYVRKSAQSGVPMYLIKDSIEAATIAADHGWLTASQQARVEPATARDKQRPAGVMQP